MKVIKTASFNRYSFNQYIETHIKIAKNCLLKLSEVRSTDYMKNIFNDIKKLLTLSIEDLQQINKVLIDLNQLKQDKDIIHTEIKKNFRSARDMIVDLQRRFPDNPFVKGLGKIWSGVGELDWQNASPMAVSNAFTHIVRQLDSALDFDWYNPKSRDQALKLMTKVPSRYDRVLDPNSVWGQGIENDPSGTKPVGIQVEKVREGLNKEQGY